MGLGERTMVKEKRKGTAGNGVDPVKDGYYSHRFRPPESSGLEKIPEGKGLLDEITLLRVLIRRCVRGGAWRRR